jgi:ubiquinone/menaquinone biosynthesis C-methylase UbiE
MRMADIKAIQQQTWATGDFSMVGVAQTLVGELLCDSVPVYAGDRVLDVATGAGNTALAAARRVCRVTGVDYVPALLDRARERAAAEHLRIEFQEGDAEALPFPEESFDVVLSTFGAMFAPDPAKAASEMLRVCRAGGKIGMANWVPDGMVGEMFQITSSFAPPPPNVPPPSQWGVPDIVRQRFGGAVSDIRFVPRESIFRHHTPETWVEHMKKYFGPTIRAHAAAGPRAAELTGALIDLARRYNESGGATWYARGAYIEAIAVKR